MKLYIQHFEGIVTAMQLSEEPLEGWTATDATEIPNTESQDGCTVAVLWDGKTLSVVQVPIPQPTHEEIEQARAAAYRATVDPITCEIQRLRDMGGSAQEIAEAEARREAAVTAVKAQWPYPEEAN